MGSYRAGPCPFGERGTSADVDWNSRDSPLYAHVFSICGHPLELWGECNSLAAAFNLEVTPESMASLDALRVLHAVVPPKTRELMLRHELAPFPEMSRLVSAEK
jgi:hypothetical protein